MGIEHIFTIIGVLVSVKWMVIGFRKGREYFNTHYSDYFLEKK